MEGSGPSSRFLSIIKDSRFIARDSYFDGPVQRRRRMTTAAGR